MSCLDFNTYLYKFIGSSGNCDDDFLYAREGLEIQPDGTRSEKEGSTFPEHNFENIIKVILENVQYDMYVMIQ